MALPPVVPVGGATKTLVACSELWGAGGPVRSLNLFVVGRVGLSFIDCEDGVVFTLKVKSVLVVQVSWRERYTYLRPMT